MKSHRGSLSIQMSKHKRPKFSDVNYEGLSRDSFNIKVQISNRGDFQRILSATSLFNLYVLSKVFNKLISLVF